MKTLFFISTILKLIIGITGMVYVILNLLKWSKVKNTPYPKDALKALFVTWLAILIISIAEYFIIKL